MLYFDFSLVFFILLHVIGQTKFTTVHPRLLTGRKHLNLEFRFGPEASWVVELLW